MGNAITGLDNHLYESLEKSIEKATEIKFNVSFLMESGAKLLLPMLVKAVQRGVKIKILTSRYMSITEPSAIYLLKHFLNDSLDIRFYNNNTHSFHPKAYFFEYIDGADLYIGSSNISRSALINGVEWNYKLEKSSSEKDYLKFAYTFDHLFDKCSIKINHKVLKEYAKSWKKSKYVIVEEEKEGFESILPSPRGAQIEALYELKLAREEGVSKGLVIAATGVGKTYLAAFDSKSFNRILFVAHREEILRQAEEAFRIINPKKSTGFFTGFEKTDDSDIIFSTVQTLSRGINITNFERDYFDYIVIDEFHHAAANTYLDVLNYFKPEFLLGLTATPFRTDNKDIYALCEDNVIYEIYLKDAINRDLLVPFNYYGIYDYSVDYNTIKESRGKYVLEDLERELSKTERADLVYNKYQQFGKSKTLAFCTSIKHANYMAKFFNKNDIKSVAVHSSTEGKYTEDRDIAIKNIKAGNIKIIFCVDIFNEGVDIPNLDTVMFLRPTESYVVFLQQLGRGLRKAKDKSYLTVLDFIGNYKRAHHIPMLLAGFNPMKESYNRGKTPMEYDYPSDCKVNFDFKVLDLFNEMKKYDPLIKRMKDDYYRIKDSLNRRPMRLDIYEGSDIPIREYLKDGWISFLAEINELGFVEQNWKGSVVEDFLVDLEKTRMSKAYKIPTIETFINNGILEWKVNLDEIGENFMDFYVNYPVHQKDLNNKSNRNWRDWDISKFTRLARINPVKFLSKGKFYNYDEINEEFYLDEELKPYLSENLLKHVKDILEYRRRDYFRRRF